jgi:hypothetical protein
MREISSPLDGFASPFGRRADLLNSTAIARLLFSSNEPGVFYDFDDWSTLFQDTAGTQPVTAANQGVALALDKRLGLELGPELVTNGTFDENVDGWTDASTPVVTVSDGIVSVTQAGTISGIFQDYPIGVGKTVEFNIRARRSGTGTPSAFTGIWTTTAADFTTGRRVQALTAEFQDYKFLMTGTAANARIYISPQVQNITIEVDSISVRELKGNHATQATTAARPLTVVHPDGGVRNEVDGSDTLATQTVAVTAQERTLSFRGTGTVTLSGASTAGPLVGTGADDIVSLTFTPTAGSLTLTVSGTVNDAMLELGAVRTPYQKRVNFLDVTEAGKRSIRRLYFNGTSHFMTTPTITPNTDKAQVFAGVRKLSDASAAILAELSPSLSTNIGSLYISAPDTGNPLRRYGSQSRGDAALSAAQLAGFRTADGDAPDSAVITATHDIAGELSRIRRNGVFGEDGAGDKGTGNFLAYPAYIGARAGTSLFFNGYLDQLITRFGTNLDSGAIETTEKYISTKSPEVPTL